jgi:hypothetical protein
MSAVKCISMVALFLVSFAAQLNAQTLQANVAGSTAFWLEAGLGAYTLGGTTTTCAWTTSTLGTSYVLDQRVPNLPQYFPFSVDNGSLWVTWTPGSTGTCATPSSDSLVWAYISLDSVLGDRCLFAQPQCLLVTSAAAGASGNNALPGVIDSALPASILAAFNNQPVSIAASDILPVDAKFATYTTLAQCGNLSSGTQFKGLGYGPGPIASTQIYSFFSVEYLNINDFNVYGFDPATGAPVPSYTITPVGAIPVIVAVNTSNLLGFGSPALTNLNRGELGLLFTTLFGRTADAMKQSFAGTGATYYGVSALIPAPLSGSYNVFEHSIPNNKELYRTQDIANCDPYGAASANPLITTRLIGDTTSYRYRVIGTQETLSQLQSVSDSIGYEFWNAENFAGVSNVKYLTVDGIDPIQDTYTAGAVPQGAALANVTLSHVADGTYPIWNEERLISYPAGAAAAATLTAYAQAQVSFGAGAAHPDFIPDSQLNVFHAHFAPFGVNFNATNTASDGPKVCGPGSNPEDGGDAGGLVFSLQAGADFCVLTNTYGSSGGVGPTNTASFGIRQ